MHSNTFSTNIMTYNIGSSIRDFDALNLSINPSLAQQERTEEYERQYQVSQQASARFLVNQASIYCLQELGQKLTERPIIQELIKNDYEVFHISGQDANTAIALSKAAFKDPEKYCIKIQSQSKQASYKEKDVTFVVATDIQTNLRLLIVSAHIPGFEYEQTEENRKFRPIDLQEGHHFCTQILKEIERIQRIENCHLQILGADMNASPDMDVERFQLFLNKGFKLICSYNPTNVNPSSKQYPKRELDYVFVKSIEPSLIAKIQSSFTSNFTAEHQLFNDIDWSINNNASDHIPVCAKVEKKMKDGQYIPVSVGLVALTGLTAYASYKFLKS